MCVCFLSFYEYVCTCATFENMNLPGLLLRRTKWPAWGDGQSSEGEREIKTQKLWYVTTVIWSNVFWGCHLQRGGSDQSDAVCGDGEDDSPARKLEVDLTQDGRQSLTHRLRNTHITVILFIVLIAWFSLSLSLSVRLPHPFSFHSSLAWCLLTQSADCLAANTHKHKLQIPL